MSRIHDLLERGLQPSKATRREEDEQMHEGRVWTRVWRDSAGIVSAGCSGSDDKLTSRTVLTGRAGCLPLSGVLVLRLSDIVPGCACSTGFEEFGRVRYGSVAKTRWENEIHVVRKIV
jgi:hypothetical protein